MRQVAQTGDARIGLLDAGINQRDMATGPLDDQTEITRATQLRTGTGIQEENQEKAKK